MLVGLLVVALVVGAVWLSTCRREGWEFQKGSKKKSEAQENKVYTLCKAGMTWGELTSNDTYKDLAKYDVYRIFGSCKKGWEDSLAEKGSGKDHPDLGRCKTQCSNQLMRKTKPCMNKDGNKCCEVGSNGKLTRCIPVSFATQREKELYGTPVPSGGGDGSSSGGGGGGGSSGGGQNCDCGRHNSGGIVWYEVPNQPGQCCIWDAAYRECYSAERRPKCG